MASQPPNQSNYIAGLLNKPTNDGVTKKKNYNKVRRLPNGLLDVSRKIEKYTKIAKENASNSPLLRLPGELRNKIYAYALGGDSVKIALDRNFGRNHVNSWEEYTDNWDITNQAPDPAQNNFSLLRVCRQLYAETMLVPYQANQICIQSDRHIDWIYQRRAGHQQAIEDISVQRYGHEYYLFDSDNATSDLVDDMKYLLETLPNLRRIHIYIKARPLWKYQTEEAMKRIDQDLECIRMMVGERNKPTELDIKRERLVQLFQQQRRIYKIVIE